MLAGDRDLVMARKALEDLDVGDEPGAGKEAFEEIVGELRVLRDTVGHRLLERVHVVDSLAREDSLAEEVLVHIGHGEGIEVDAPRAREDELEQGAPADLGQRRGHPRLQEGVAFHDAPVCGIEAREVQGVRHRSDQAPRRFPRQARVGVECDHVTNARGCKRSRHVGCHERRVGGAAQEAVELPQLPALALPTHPDLLSLVPEAAAVE